MGYPGIAALDDTGDEIKGYIFYSDTLESHWCELDNFEGDEYKRVLTKVKMKDKVTVEAYIYILKES